MFKLQRTPSYWWTVNVAFADGDKWIEESFECEFTRLDVPAFEALQAQVLKEKLRDPAVCQKVVLNWRGVAGADGQVLAFSDKALADVCRMPGVASAMVRTFLDTFEQAGAKNS